MSALVALLLCGSETLSNLSFGLSFVFWLLLYWDLTVQLEGTRLFYATALVCAWSSKIFYEFWLCIFRNLGSSKHTCGFWNLNWRFWFVPWVGRARQSSLLRERVCRWKIDEKCRFSPVDSRLFCSFRGALCLIRAWSVLIRQQFLMEEWRLLRPRAARLLSGPGSPTLSLPVEFLVLWKEGVFHGSATGDSGSGSSTGEGQDDKGSVIHI